MLHQRRPGLLPVDDIVVAIAHGRRAQAGKIRTRARLRIALAPPILPRQDARQEMRLLLGRAESVDRSEEHTSELQSLMRISYAVFCLKQKKKQTKRSHQKKLN